MAKNVAKLALEVGMVLLAIIVLAMPLTKYFRNDLRVSLGLSALWISILASCLLTRTTIRVFVYPFALAVLFWPLIALLVVAACKFSHDCI